MGSDNSKSKRKVNCKQMSRVYSENNNSDMMGAGNNGPTVWSDWEATHESSNILSNDANSVNSTRSSHRLRGTRGYATNNHFPDSQFISEDENEPQQQGQDGFSSIIYNNNNDDSHNSSLRSPVGTSSSIADSVRKYSDDPFDTVQQRHKSSNRTTVEDPEYLAYLRSGKKQQPQEQLLYPQQMSQNDLIVKGIGEVSGEVYNTFKNKIPQSKRNGGASNSMTNNTMSTTHTSEDDSFNETSNEVLRAANDVYNGMISQTTKNKLPLITPEAAGLNFQNNLGKWVMNKDETNSQDISANHTVADISSSTTTQPPLNSSLRPMSQSPRKNKNKNSDVFSDTPLPFKIKNILPEESIDIDSNSLKTQKIALVHKLTPLLLNKNWDNLTWLDASNLNLNNVSGLNICFPKLRSCNLSNNGIKLFDLIHSIPPQLIELNLSNNFINETYLHESEVENMINNNVKILNLSGNKFNNDLTWLNEEEDDDDEKFPNLKELNLSNNEIKSMMGLPTFAMIEKIDLSNNNISGIIDFQELISRGQNTVYNWSYVKELDLSGNKITHVYNLHVLKSLTHLNLNNNPLRGLYYPNDVVMDHLIELQIMCENDDSLIHIGGDKRQFLPFPNLQILKINCYVNFQDMESLPNGLIRLSICNGKYENLIPWNKYPGSLQILEITKIKGLIELPWDNLTEIWFTSLQLLSLQDNDLFSWTNLVHFLPFTHLKRLELNGNERLLMEQNRIDRTRLEPELRELLMNAIPSLEVVTI